MFEKILNQLKQSDLELLEDWRQTKNIIGGTVKALSTSDDTIVDLFNFISEQIWQSDISIETKVEIGLEFYDRFPTYFHGLVPYKWYSSDKTIPEQLMQACWKQFSKYLDAAVEHRKPVEYVLWVDFFEDPETVVGAWHGMLQACKLAGNEAALLELSGPVPWELKSPLFIELLNNPNYHHAILRALLFSLIDVLGQTNKDGLTVLLRKLDVDTQCDEYYLLEEKLKS